MMAMSVAMCKQNFWRRFAVRVYRDPQFPDVTFEAFAHVESNDATFTAKLTKVRRS